MTFVVTLPCFIVLTSLANWVLRSSASSPPRIRSEWGRHRSRLYRTRKSDDWMHTSRVWGLAHRHTNCILPSFYGFSMCFFFYKVTFPLMILKDCKELNQTSRLWLHVYMYFILIEFNSQDCGELLGKTVCNEIVFVFEIKITSLEIRQDINLHFMYSINMMLRNAYVTLTPGRII